MNRFFRSALFPLIVIVLLVYLASQTLMRGEKKEAKLTTSAFIQQIKTNPQRITDVTIDPNKQKVSFKLSGTNGSVHYAAPADEHQIQNLMQQRGVECNSKGTGSSPWWARLTSLQPFVLLFRVYSYLGDQLQVGVSKVIS